MQTRRKRFLFSSAFLLFFLFSSISLSQTSQNTNTPYLYNNKQDCLDKNIGPNGSPNDLIKLICDTANYPKTSKDIEENEKFNKCNPNGGCGSREDFTPQIKEKESTPKDFVGPYTKEQEKSWTPPAPVDKSLEYYRIRSEMKYNPSFNQMSENEQRMYACTRMNGGHQTMWCPY
jgi:hypothetical protein